MNETTDLVSVPLIDQVHIDSNVRAEFNTAITQIILQIAATIDDSVKPDTNRAAYLMQTVFDGMSAFVVRLLGQQSYQQMHAHLGVVTLNDIELLKNEHACYNLDSIIFTAKKTQSVDTIIDSLSDFAFLQFIDFISSLIPNTTDYQAVIDSITEKATNANELHMSPMAAIMLFMSLQLFNAIIGAMYEGLMLTQHMIDSLAQAPQAFTMPDSVDNDH